MKHHNFSCFVEILYWGGGGGELIGYLPKWADIDNELFYLENWTFLRILVKNLTSTLQQ